MGWMHDTLQYFALDPIYRRFHHNNLTFGLTYAFAENFVLALSHDEVVHGKGSLLRKMHGDRWRKFANLRAYYAFMYTHPGKKLLFMGGEFAQEREWNHDQGLDWHLLDDVAHRGVQQLVRDLNRLYRAHAPLHELDCRSDGFEWIDCTDVEKNVICYLRRDGRRRHVVTVCNFSPEPRHNYRVGVPDGGEYVELINTDAVEYGGSGMGNAGRVWAEAIEAHGRPHSLVLTLPPLATLVLGPAGDL
jgi:1,4-alpha-glucan branching enzyme